MSDEELEKIFSNPYKLTKILCVALLDLALSTPERRDRLQNMIDVKNMMNVNEERLDESRKTTLARANP